MSERELLETELLGTLNHIMLRQGVIGSALHERVQKRLLERLTQFRERDKIE